MADIPLAPALDELRAQRERIHAGADAVGPHALRVATRRLDAWLRIGGWHVLRPDLRWIRGVAEPVRDADVLLSARPRGKRANDVLVARGIAQDTLVAALVSPRFAALLTALEQLPPVPRELARQRARKLARVAASQVPTTLPEVHLLRRRVRRARYAIEWVGDSAGPLVRVQDALGQISDRQIGRRSRGAGTGTDDLALGRAALEDAREFLLGWR